MGTDYYAILGVGQGASTEEIKKAYRRKAREMHPDANPDDPQSEERFKDLTLAYDTLRDPDRRRRYDMFGPDGVTVGAGGSPFGDAFGGGVGDIFDAFFGGSVFGSRGGGRRSRVQQGPDAAVDVQVDFEVAAFGGEVAIEAELLQACGHCQGSGAQPGTSPVRCRRCQGRGEVQEVRRSLLGSMMVSTTCPVCLGSGEEIDSRCPECRGDGRVAETTTLRPKIPAGIDDNTQLRISQAGHAGPRGGPAGDLYIRLRVNPHPTLERQGSDLVYRARIGYPQAALGARIEVPTLDGSEELVIPAGTQPGKVFTLRRGGMPVVNTNSRGDLKVIVEVDVPAKASGEEEKLLRRLAELRGEDVSTNKGILGRIKSAFT